ncbi:MAG: decarboxylating 6-phosphogluconate dehydrogenase [Planctomycetes bacterium]|nr:decarboxylating 6-phosphogluconate dehydrogenase [Planctomycetota bacterium]
MQIGMVGLGRMGANMVRRLLRGGHECVVWNRDFGKSEELQKVGAQAARSVEELVQALKRPRAVWVMLPAGDVTEEMVQRLGRLLEKGDVVVDGGNTYFKDDVRRSKVLAEKGIHYVDCGTSGGVWGADRGYCLMAGGSREAIAHLTPALRTLAPGMGEVPPTPGRSGGTAQEGFLHCGPVGAGHFVKMVHNGIEYGIMQAYAEGFDLMQSQGGTSVPGDMRYELELQEIAELWRRGSVVGSWLLDLTAMALQEDPKLARYSGFVQDSGEGRWTVQAAVENAVPAEVLTAALFARFRSRQEHTYAEKVLSAMREKFGGHVEPAKAH